MAPGRGRAASTGGGQCRRAVGRCRPGLVGGSRPPFALQPPEQPPYPHHQGGPPHCPPWNNSHEGMWGEQRGDPGWNGQRDAPWNSQPDPNWNSQFEGPWNSQHEQPPWGGGQREPPFRMQRPPHFRGPFPPHQQHPQFNQPPHPHNFNRFPPRFMQDDFPPRHPFERPPYPHRFDYPQGDFPAGECEGALRGGCPRPRTRPPSPAPRSRPLLRGGASRIAPLSGLMAQLRVVAAGPGTSPESR